MKYEIINLQDEQVIGISKEIAFNNPSECSMFWGEYVERIVKPVYKEGKEPEGMALYSLKSGRWLKVHFEVGRIYFIGIWVFHKLLVKSLFRKAINK